MTDNPKQYFFRPEEGTAVGEFIRVPQSVVVSIQADTLAALRSMEGDDDRS